MELLREKRGFQEFPVDLTSKAGQRFIKTIAFELTGELYEAIAELKNSKDHRVTEVSELDREHLLEEMVDVFKYTLELFHLMGFTTEEFVEAFYEKGRINRERILNGY